MQKFKLKYLVLNSLWNFTLRLSGESFFPRASRLAFEIRFRFRYSISSPLRIIPCPYLVAYNTKIFV